MQSERRRNKIAVRILALENQQVWLKTFHSKTRKIEKMFRIYNLQMTTVCYLALLGNLNLPTISGLRSIHFNRKNALRSRIIRGFLFVNVLA